MYLERVSRKFTKKIEDFQCEYCGNFVKGDGYTNHCSKCLWSKHVDIFPGDRASDCGGLMEPVALEMAKGQYVIIHRCKKCGVEKRNIAQNEDLIEEYLRPMI